MAETDWIVAVGTILTVMGGFISWLLIQNTRINKISAKADNNEQVFNTFKSDHDKAHSNSDKTFENYKLDHQRAHEAVDKRFDDGSDHFDEFNTKMFEVTNRLSNIEQQNRNREAMDANILETLRQLTQTMANQNADIKVLAAEFKNLEKQSNKR